MWKNVHINYIEYGKNSTLIEKIKATATKYFHLKKNINNLFAFYWKIKNTGHTDFFHNFSSANIQGKAVRIASLRGR